MRADNALISVCTVNQPGYGGFIWTHSDGLTGSAWITADVLTWPRLAQPPALPPRSGNAVNPGGRAAWS